MDTDDLDRQLISLLQADARASTADLARRLGVARTTVVARLARLERSGVIVGYTVRLGRDAAQPAVIAALQRLPELVQLSSVSGEFDYIALLQAPGTQRLDALLDTIGQVDGVLKTTTSVVLAVKIDRQA